MQRFESPDMAIENFSIGNPVRTLLSSSDPRSTRPSNSLIDVFSVLYTYNIRSQAWCAAWVNVNESKHAGLKQTAFRYFLHVAQLKSLQ